MGYYSAIKINEASSHRKTWKTFSCILLSKGRQSEKATLQDPDYMTLWKTQKYGDRTKD
jgi:hypothetical protein